MLQVPGATSYMGSIGKDKYGEEMKKNSKLAGVNVSFFFYRSCFIRYIIYYYVGTQRQEFLSAITKMTDFIFNMFF